METCAQRTLLLEGHRHKKISDKRNALIQSDSLVGTRRAPGHDFFLRPPLLRLCHQKLLCSFFLCARREVNGDDNGSWSRLLSGQRATFHPLPVRIFA